MQWPMICVSCHLFLLHNRNISTLTLWFDFDQCTCVSLQYPHLCFNCSDLCIIHSSLASSDIFFWMLSAVSGYHRSHFCVWDHCSRYIYCLILHFRCFSVARTPLHQFQVSSGLGSCLLPCGYLEWWSGLMRPDTTQHSRTDLLVSTYISLIDTALIHRENFGQLNGYYSAIRYY
jgi:hypothetical protein